jgi:hypothetical protein
MMVRDDITGCGARRRRSTRWRMPAVLPPIAAITAVSVALTVRLLSAVRTTTLHLVTSHGSGNACRRRAARLLAGMSRLV